MKVACRTFKESVLQNSGFRKFNTEALTTKQQKHSLDSQASCTLKKTKKPQNTQCHKTNSIHCACVCPELLTCAESYKRVSRWCLQLEARMSCLHCVGPFSSLLSDSSSVPTSATADSSTLLMCPLRRAKPGMHRRRESVLRPRVRPRYAVLQGATGETRGQKEKKKTRPK